MKYFKTLSPLEEMLLNNQLAALDQRAIDRKKVSFRLF